MPVIPANMQSQVAQFHAKAQSFQHVYATLGNNSNAYAKFPALDAQYKALMSRASGIKITIVEIGRKIDDAIQWLKGNLGLGELSGFILPIAIMVAGAAFMSKWMEDAYTLNKKLSAAQALEKKGIPPSRAADIVAKISNTPGIFSGAKGFIIPAIIGIAAIYFIPKLMDNK